MPRNGPVSLAATFNKDLTNSNYNNNKPLIPMNIPFNSSGRSRQDRGAEVELRLVVAMATAAAPAATLQSAFENHVAAFKILPKGPRLPLA